PDAPRPVGKPALAATMDQKATSAYARLQGYRRVLAETRRAAADERDEKLISGLADAVRLGRNWELASDRLTGLSYTFSASADERALFELTMRLFGPAREQLPAPRGAPIGVGVSDRSFGLSLGLAPMFSDEWRGWLDIEQPDRVVEQLRASDFDPTLYGLAFPRTLALLSINVDRIVSDTLPGSFEPLFGHRDRLRRFELATSGLGSDSFGGDPQFVALLALEPDTPSDEQRDVFRALPTGVRVLARAAEDAPMLDALGGEADAGEKGADQAPPSDRWVVLRGGEGEGPAVRYYAHPSAENPFAFVTYGLSEQRARDELDRARTGDRRARGDSVFYARVEPPTLLSVLGAFESKSLAPLDPGVLAQRIGPLVATIRPVATPDAQTIVYTFELQPPPEL
ncbi:MAG: hypothetical protein ABEL76_09520, partial [Bradymonadaceae bacterium]